MEQEACEAVISVQDPHPMRSDIQATKINNRIGKKLMNVTGEQSFRSERDYY